MTFFAPALLYTVLFADNWILSGVLWGLMCGYRPSDGVFVLPFLLWVLWRQNDRFRAAFLCAVGAVPVALVWFIPTYLHFHSASGQAHEQVASLQNGIFSNAPVMRKLANVVHILCGSLNAWNVLVAFIVLGAAKASSRGNELILYLLPGFLFWTCYYYSDPTYLSYLIAPGILLAAISLKDVRPKFAQAIVCAAIVISVSQMTFLKPVAPTGILRVTLNCYILDFSGAGIDSMRYESVQQYLKANQKR